MGGFDVSTIATLEFPDGALQGAVVRARLNLSVAEFFEMQERVSGLSDGVEEFDADKRQRLEALIIDFGSKRLVSWNLTDDGDAIPPNAEGMMRLPIAVAIQIFEAWSAAVAAPSPNSRAASVNGSTSEAEFEGMAAV